jgi:hypothetical protein
MPTSMTRTMVSQRMAFFTALSFTLLVFAVQAARAPAQTTAFTYQGQLTEAGTGANGNYDLQCALFDIAAGGTQIGATQTVPTVPVSNGLFTVQLDFGVNAFPGANRFLEIGVRPVGGGSFTTLAPRQQISSTPYAIRTLSAATADALSSTCTGCVQDTQIQSVAGSKVSGTIPVASVPGGSGNYIQNRTTEQPDANFNISGNGHIGGDLTVDGALDVNLGGNFIQNQTTQQANANFNISGDGTAGGTLSANVLAATTQFNIGGNRVLSRGPFSVFAGVGAGQANTTGAFNAFVGDGAGASNVMGGSNSFFGASAGDRNTGNRNTFVGREAGGLVISGSNNTAIGSQSSPRFASMTNATAIGANASVETDNSLVLGSINGVGGASASTNVGIGTTSPAARLHVVGSTGLIGKVGIFTTNPQRDGLQIGSSLDALFTLEPGSSPNAAFIRFGDHTGWKLHFGRNREGSGQQLNGSTTGLLMTIQDNGNVGIGTTTPAALLTVNGTTAKPGGGSWGSISDERLKTIKGRFTPGVDAVMQLQPIRYEYTPDNALGIRATGEHIGFGAHAVQKVIPEAVSTNEQGYLMVNNDPILWTMLNAIKEQQREIEQLREDLRQLRAAGAAGS